MPQQIQMRRGDAADWTTANSLLMEGEIGVELDTGRFKVGDGSTQWNSLGYAQAPASWLVPIIEVEASDNDYAVLKTERGYMLRFVGTGAKTANFDVAQAYAAGDVFHITNRAASDNLTLTPDSSITLNPPKDGSLVLEPGDSVTVHFVSAGEADVFGSTEISS